jgi:hypothetical protein
MLKKTIIISGAGLALALASTVFAQTVVPGGVVQTTPAPASVPGQQMILHAEANGKVLLRGTIDSVSGSTLTVKSWGGDWTINVPASAEVFPAAATLASFKVGDFIGIQGSVNQNASWTVDATLVRDWTERQVVRDEIKNNVQSARQEMRANTPRTLQGTISNLSGQTFTLTTDNGVVYSGALTSNAKILMNNWLTLDFSRVQNGDIVRVWGPVSSSTITGSIFRDTSITK